MTTSKVNTLSVAANELVAGDRDVMMAPQDGRTVA